MSRYTFTVGDAMPFCRGALVRFHGQPRMELSLGDVAQWCGPRVAWDTAGVFSRRKAAQSHDRLLILTSLRSVRRLCEHVEKLEVLEVLDSFWRWCLTRTGSVGGHWGTLPGMRAELVRHVPEGLTVSSVQDSVVLAMLALLDVAQGNNRVTGFSRACDLTLAGFGVLGGDAWVAEMWRQVEDIMTVSPPLTRDWTKVIVPAALSLQVAEAPVTGGRKRVPQHYH